MDRDILIQKKQDLEYELDELNKKKTWTIDEEKRVHDIKKMKLKIKDMLKRG